ncbi:MAG: hypothetical protein WCE51_07105 [Chthoniobacterales bacterium]
MPGIVGILEPATNSLSNLKAGTASEASPVRGAGDTSGVGLVEACNLEWAEHPLQALEA